MADNKITGIFREASVRIASDLNNWLAFLSTSSQIYDQPFTAQVLIHAQNPAATQCATLREWNTAGRWVRKEAKAIAVIKDIGKPDRVLFYFDLADTIPMRGTRPYFDWILTGERRADAIAQLSADSEEKSEVMFESWLYGYINDLVLEHAEDNYDEIIDHIVNAYSYDLEPDEIMGRFCDLATASVAYSVISRCGGDVGYLAMDSFIDLGGYTKSLDAFAGLGTTVTYISGVILGEIAQIVRDDSLAKIRIAIDNEGVAPGKPQEMRKEVKTDDQPEIQPDRGLPVPGTELPDGENTELGEIRSDAQTVPDGTPPDDISEPDDEWEAGHEAPTDRQTGAGTSREDHGAIGTEAEDAGQENGLDGLDWHDEPAPEPGRGNSDPGSGYEQISLFEAPDAPRPADGPFRAGSTPTGKENTGDMAGDLKSPAFINDLGEAAVIGPVKEITSEDIAAALRDGSGVVGGKQRIHDYYQTDHSTIDRINYLKEQYGTGGRSFTFPDGSEGSIDYSPKGFNICKNGFGGEPSLSIKWGRVDKEIRALVLTGRYIDTEKFTIPHHNETASDIETVLADAHITIEGDTATIDSKDDGSGQYVEFDVELPEDNHLSENAVQQSTTNAPPNFRIPREFVGSWGIGSIKIKIAHNLDAIRMLKELELEERPPDPDEQEIMARYVGWGGLPQIFDEGKPEWAEANARLHELLTDSEYKAARASTLNAHYTSPIVIQNIYSALENMGFRNGNVLEPSCGVGNFFGMLPDSMQGSKLYGTELDSITGRLGRQAYPQADIEIIGFEDTNYPDAFFDVAVGNIPFGGYKVADKRYDHLNFNIHDYFFAKTIDKVRPGGIIAMVTSMGTLDKKDETVRKYLCERAELLGIIRLPNTAFAGNAGTEVTTDILFLKRRDRHSFMDERWIHLSETPEGVPINQYYIDNPHMCLGEMVWDKSMYGNEKSTACHPVEGRDLAANLADAIQYVRGSYEPEKEKPDAALEDKSIPADPSVRNYSFTLVNDRLYFRINSIMEPVMVNDNQEKRIRKLMGIRDCVRELIELQQENRPDEEISAKQAELNSLYDAFIKPYGRINNRANSYAFRDDDGYYLLCSLEVMDNDGNFTGKADMFTKRTIRPARVLQQVETSTDALAVCISERARVDIPYMQGLFAEEKSIENITKDLEGIIFHDPLYPKDDLEGWQPFDEYLSGNVREKLRAAQLVAESDPDYLPNVEALTAVQPKDIDASEIEVRLGATWVPKKDVQDFMYELLQTSSWLKGRIQVLYSERSGEWNITNKSAEGSSNNRVNLTYGTRRINAYHIIENTLNLRNVKVFDYFKDNDGKNKRELNIEETIAAQQRQDSIKQAFKDWVFSDFERRERLCALYNERFNSVRPREYDGSHIRFVGMNPEITLAQHQVNAVARHLYGGNTLLAHVVGAGKTFEIAAAIMESKRIGLSYKAMIAVPNHLTQQFAGEFLQLYPSANLLVTTQEDFEKDKRKEFCGRIATGEYDAVIIGHSQFGKIPMSDERQIAMIEWQLEELEIEMEELKAQEDTPRYTVKQVEKSKKSLETRLKRLMDDDNKDSVVTFEELGVDKLCVDEAHKFKNLFLFTKMKRIAGVGSSEAQKSTDLYMKCQYLDEITGERGTIFSTGTPISNSMSELYTMMRYQQASLLRQTGLNHFDSWASTFGETITSLELKPEGTGFRPKERFARFYNLPELMNMWKQCADIQTADMLNLPVPKLMGGAPIDKVSEPSPYQKEILKLLADRAKTVRAGCDPRKDNMLSITNDGRKMALDQRLYDPNLPDDPSSKLNVCVENVLRIWKETAAGKSTQVIFCDLGTPKKTVAYYEDSFDAETGQRFDLSFDVYQDIFQKLRRNGVPSEQIAFIHDAKSDNQKTQLYAKVRSGQVRVLLGSTEKMGAGTNIQARLIALHHLDVPWRPSDIEQREGRMLRQGNMNEEVQIYRYVTKGTFDAYSWAIIKNKQTFIAQIMTSKNPVRSCEDMDESVLSYAEVMALATGDARIKERVELETRLARLKVLKASHKSQQYELETKVNKDYPRSIEWNRQNITHLTQDMQVYERERITDPDAFVMTINDIQYSDKEKAGSALLIMREKGTRETVSVGQYCGFPLEIEYDIREKSYLVVLAGALRHKVTLGPDPVGNIQRINNKLSGLSAEIEKSKTSITHWEQQIEFAKEELGKPFPQEEEFHEKQQRFDELTIELNMAEKQADLTGDSEEGSPELPEKECLREKVAVGRER